MKLSSIFLLLTIFTAACGFIVPASTATFIPTTTNTKIATVTPLSTVTNTQIPIPTSTLTPFPTLSSNAKETLILTLLETNDGCSLPCWWGITPGTTSWAEAKDHLSSLGLQTGKPFIINSLLNEYSIHGGLEVYKGKLHIRGTFIERDGQVDSIKIQSNELHDDVANLQTAFENYSPQNILQRYGKPSRIWLIADVQSHYGDRTGYSLSIFYDNVGFVVRYVETMNYASVYHICPRFNKQTGIDGITIFLTSPTNPRPLEELMLIGQPKHLPTVAHYWIEELNYSIDDFYKLVGNQEKSGCLDIPEGLLKK